MLIGHQERNLLNTEKNKSVKAVRRANVAREQTAYSLFKMSNQDCLPYAHLHVVTYHFVKFHQNLYISLGGDVKICIVTMYTVKLNYLCQRLSRIELSQSQVVRLIIYAFLFLKYSNSILCQVSFFAECIKTKLKLITQLKSHSCQKKKILGYTVKPCSVSVTCHLKALDKINSRRTSYVNFIALVCSKMNNSLRVLVSRKKIG